MLFFRLAEQQLLHTNPIDQISLQMLKLLRTAENRRCDEQIIREDARYSHGLTCCSELYWLGKLTMYMFNIRELHLKSEL